MIQPEDRTLLQPYLLAGEHLLWTSRPQQGIVLRSHDLYLVPLGIFFAGFAVAWNFPVWESVGRSFSAFDFLFIAAGFALLAFGFYALVGRFFHEAWLRRHLLYAVTSQRIMVLRTGRWGGVSSVELGYLPTLEFEEHRGGRGTFCFDFDDEEGLSWKWWWLGQRNEIWTRPLRRLSGLRFDSIENPRTVYELIRREADRCRNERQTQPPGRYDFIG